jgi:hypothetical protein
MNHEKRLVKIVIGDGSPIRTHTPQRNLKCYCGSGKKQKNCHGVETKFYSTKPKEPIIKKVEQSIEDEKVLIENENLPVN